MKINPWGFEIVFVLIATFLMFNNFQLPTIFLFEKTEKTKAKTTEIQCAKNIGGRPLQLLTYNYTVSDSTYTNKFKP